MVQINNKERYKCPYCEKVYDDWNDAMECAAECVNPDEPIKINYKKPYICEMCGNDYKQLKNAEMCEKTHKKLDDKHYQNFLIKQNFLELKKAAEHESQTKLR